MDMVALALEYLHQQGILHLNLNARNVFISSHDQLFIAEAGLLGMLAPQKSARNATASQQPLELENGTPLLRDQQGRPLYGLNLASAPAPELLLGQSPDTSSDVYALGALLYYLLTGHRPMRGKTLAEIADQHLHATIPSFARWRQDIPGELDHLLEKAMAKQRATRVRHPEALANAYAEIIAPGENRRRVFAAPDRLPAVSKPQSTAHPSAYPPAHSTARFSRRRAIMLIATGGSVVAAGISALVIMHTSATGTPVTSTTGTIPAKSAPVRSNTPGHNGTVIAQTRDIPVNSAKTFPLASSANPGVLIHLPDSQFVAFNSTCTHAGCAVAYNGQSHLLECPCHNASFDPTRNAAVVNGPASSPLAAIAITVNKDGTITTHG
jgi:Rieske Fe-S protein